MQIKIKIFYRTIGQLLSQHNRLIDTRLANRFLNSDLQLAYNTSNYPLNEIAEYVLGSEEAMDISNFTSTEIKTKDKNLSCF